MDPCMSKLVTSFLFISLAAATRGFASGSSFASSGLVPAIGRPVSYRA
jgi:hypothetical protein